MPSVVVIGGGFAGCGAAAAAARAGVKTTLIERMDTLGGLGQAGGSSRMAGQFTAHEEAIAMGAPDVVGAMDAEIIFTNIELPSQAHVRMYNCQTISNRLTKNLKDLGIDVRFKTRAAQIKQNGESITSVITDDKEEFKADAFVDTSGGFGPQGMCGKYGNGCTTCLMRCPTFGGRVSIADKAGIKEWMGTRAGGETGSFSAAFTLLKESLGADVQKILEKNGFGLMKIPKKLIPGLLDKLHMVAPAVTAEHAEELTLTYMGKGKIGWVNVVGLPYMTMEELRQVPGFEEAVFVQPFTGWIGNAIRYMAVTPRDKTLKVNGLKNVFTAGEKMGGQPNGVTEAATSGALAGYNAARIAVGKEPIELHTDCVIGDFVSYTADHQNEHNIRHSYIWGVYFNHMKEKGLYSIDAAQIQQRIKKSGLTGFFGKKVV